MIDIHAHIGRLYHREKKPLTARYLLGLMDTHGIEQAALLPIESPEETDYYITTEEILRVCKRHPDRFIPFCNVDPRRRNADMSTDFRSILTEYRDRGCKGFGEAMCGFWVDDPRLQLIYEACGELGLPIVFHMDHLRNMDEKGLPRFESVISKFPETIFIGHGQHFWAEVSADVTEGDFGRYPEGKVVAPGAVERLLATYPNAYADLSAGSAWNAISRDPQYGAWFLDRFQDKLLFGTDVCVYDMKMPMIAHLRSGILTPEAYEKITRGNALRILAG